MEYIYKYPMIALTADVVLFEHSEEPRILLIKRGQEPFKDMWALPGGHVNVSNDGDQGEDCETAARRELLEETGINLSYLREMGTYTKPGRDPRGRVVSVAFLGILEAGSQELQVGDDAAEAKWFPMQEVTTMDLAFDHQEIVMHAILTLSASFNDEE